ncbi:MAG TPA: class I SAM-dependent methyltransferase [Steroidobacteraceae bacterium]|jgi:SAM-dependent methyltransferase|nr:class I SAM-dependent methyltransferase [Steroidobacteraceae bacterium]
MTTNDHLFDNRAFWNRRYADDPSLGSGIGSRGANLLHKRQVIEEFLQEAAPATVLDVGCGDHEVLRQVAHLPGYVGLDVSEVVVARNRQAFPQRRFECLDFIHCAELESLRADVVLCMEVLIHQHRREQFDGLLRNIVAAAVTGGLISGYMFDPRPTIPSAIIAWHEPITDALMRSGARSVSVEARSLETDCLAFVSFSK